MNNYSHIIDIDRGDIIKYTNNIINNIDDTNMEKKSLSINKKNPYLDYRQELILGDILNKNVSSLNNNNMINLHSNHIKTNSLYKLSNNINSVITDNMQNKKSIIYPSMTKILKKKEISSPSSTSRRLNLIHTLFKHNDKDDSNSGSDSNSNSNNCDKDRDEDNKDINDIKRRSSDEFSSDSSVSYNISHNNGNSNNNNNTNNNTNYNIDMDPTKLINEHLDELQYRILGHRTSSIIYKNREKIITFPITILTTFIASSIMIDLSDSKSTSTFKTYIKYTGLMISFLLGLLNELRKYFDYQTAHKEHDLSGKLYTTLLRSIEIRLIKNKLNKTDKQDIFQDIINQMSIIEQYEPDIPTKIDTKIRGSKILHVK
jgi:hypothetical protein